MGRLIDYIPENSKTLNEGRSLESVQALSVLGLANVGEKIFGWASIWDKIEDFHAKINQTALFPLSAMQIFDYNMITDFTLWKPL